MAFTLAVGLAGEIALMAVNASDVTLWVGVICSAIITVATCIIQVYKMFRDRDSDRTDTTDEKTDENTDEKTDTDPEQLTIDEKGDNEDE